MDRIRAPNGVHIRNARTGEYVTLHGKGNFAGVIRELEMGRASQVIWVGQGNPKDPSKTEAGGSESRAGNLTEERTIRVMDEKGHRPRNAGRDLLTP